MVNGNLAEGNSLPLSFSSFELLRKGSRLTNKTQKYDIMDDVIEFLEMDDEKDDKPRNQSQHMKKPGVCNKGFNLQKEYEGFQLNFSSCLSILESLCQERSISLDSFEEKR